MLKVTWCPSPSHLSHGPGTCAEGKLVTVLSSGRTVVLDSLSRRPQLSTIAHLCSCIKRPTEDRFSSYVDSLMSN